MRNEVKVKFYFDDKEPSEKETFELWGKLAYKLLEISQQEKEKKDAKCFKISGSLRKKESVC